MNDVPVSRIGLGTATFGREIDAAASIALLDWAWAHGIRHFDTAAAYSAGESEKILGTWLGSRAPSGAKIVTKLLPPFGATDIRTKIDESLQRLGRESVDVLFLHRWDETLGTAGLEALQEARTAGKFRELGLSNVSAPRLRAVLEAQQAHGWQRFEYLQCNQNYAVSELDEAMRSVCTDHALKVETFSPLGAGFLTGKHRTGVVPGSRFDLVPGHQAIYFTPQAQARLNRLLHVAEETASSAEHLALAWALRRGVETVLVGARHKGHLEQAFEARDRPNGKALEALVHAS